MSEGIDKGRLFLGLALLAIGLVGFVQRDAVIKEMREPGPRSRNFSYLDSPWPMSDSQRESHRKEENRENEELRRWHNKETFKKQAVFVVSGVVFLAGLGIAVFSLGGKKPAMR